MARQKRFTIYDMMEEKGVFDANPANPFSRDNDGQPLYKGPVQYPKMLYHPKGEEKIVVPAEELMTPFGPKKVGEKRELVSMIVNDSAEEKKWKSLGWHDHPAKAIMAQPEVEGQKKVIPQMGSDMRIAQLEEEKAKLEAALEEANKLKDFDLKSGGHKPSDSNRPHVQRPG